MAKYQAEEPAASDPGHCELSIPRLLRVEPALRGWRGFYWKFFHVGMDYEKQLDRHLYLGDSRPACVMSLEPLLVAAYSDDLDCVVMLKYPSFLIEEHQLKVGSHLLTINSYFEGKRVARDLTPGPNQHGPWTNFYPMIAEFFSDDGARIAERKAEITEEEWDRCQALGELYLEKFPGRFRNASPLYCDQPR